MNNAIDDNIAHLIEQEINDETMVVEPIYENNSTMTHLKNSEHLISDITLDELDEPNLKFKVKITLTNNKTEYINGTYNLFLMVPVAKRYIKFGEILQKNDLTTHKIKMKSLTHGYATNMSEVLGLQAKKNLFRGALIKLSDIALPNVIKNGDPVNIVYDSKTINLKTMGSAMGSGAVGDMVKVKNSTSGAVLLGEIINKNTVRIGGDNE